MNGCLDGWLHGWMVVQINICVGGQMDRRMVWWMDRWIDGWMDNWLFGWMNEWMGGCVGGWLG